ncbi:hypothetical protein BDZ97DRAFT_1916589 [Flammula alnicola]|nr:hypothetical protein BDZ97DRAFT_1916589 [Flammula alnicola]
MSFLRLSKSRPDKHTNRMAWNESWEKDLDIYETFRYKFPSIPLLQPPNHSPKDRIGVEMGLMAFNQTFHNDLFLLQQDVCRRATTRLATDDFAEKWTALKPACREEYILEALYKTSTAGPDFEQFRQWCPDLKVDTLGREGASYLDLLMFLIQSNSEANGKVALVFFPHPMVDRIFNAIQDLEGQTYALKLRMNRSFFITMTLHQ